MPAPPVVFDSHALLKLLRDESGAEEVEKILTEAARRDEPAHMTEVNYAEVQYIVRRKDGEAAWQTIARELVAAPIQFHVADRVLADRAADFKTRFKISLADAFAAALAKEQNAELVTGDREFRVIEGQLKKIRWLK
jgi:predicted nucleic acid-binding protein